MSGTENKFLQSLQTEATTGRAQRVKPTTVGESISGAVRFLMGKWKAEGAKPADLPEPVEVGRMIRDAVLASVSSDVAGLAATLAATTLTEDDVTLSRNGNNVTLRATVRDDQTGASASVSIRYDVKTVYGQALASVAPSR